VRNCASTVLDARGARSVDSRILSSAAITKSRAGSVICSDRAKFCARMQFFFSPLLLTLAFKAGEICCHGHEPFERLTLF